MHCQACGPAVVSLEQKAFLAVLKTSARLPCSGILRAHTGDTTPHGLYRTSQKPCRALRYASGVLQQQVLLKALSVSCLTSGQKSKCMALRMVAPRAVRLACMNDAIG